MSTSSITELSARRAQLSAQADFQRDALAVYYRQFDRPARTVDTALTVVNFLRSPLVLTAITAVLVRTKWSGFTRIPRLLWKGATFLWALNRMRK